MRSEGFYRTALQAAEKNGTQSGKIFLITGAYSGIGVETTKALLSVKGQVILAGRNSDLMKEFVDMLKKQDFDAALIDGDGPPLDLGDLATVKSFAEYVCSKYKQLDCLILNAGVMMTPPGTTRDGFETQVGINVVGHFLLAKTLESITKRQVWVSSMAHKMSGANRFDFEYFTNFDEKTSKYDTMRQYQQSKLGNILLAKEFAKRNNNQMEAVSLHPGVIKTNLGRHLSWFVSTAFQFITAVGIMKAKTVEQGAATTVTCATLLSTNLKNGAYYDDCQVGVEDDCAKNEEDAKRLYDLCDELTKKFQ